FYRRINILHRLRRKKQYYTAFRGGLAAMPLISGIIKRSIRFIRNKYKVCKPIKTADKAVFTGPHSIAVGGPPHF
ncbi:MAG: hypothetical protein II272_09995, partial [Oscillospiraceae bacterium]|nr:hypothetical protein [Oscillospiraceae bacterium]